MGRGLMGAAPQSQSLRADIALPDGSVRAPDAAWISFDRLRPLSSQDLAGFAPVCPEFVIELRSP